MPVAFTAEDIRQKYNSFARQYDLGDAIPELLGVSRLRRRLLHRASGEVLEVAVGTGRNLPYYPRSCRITAVDLSPAMLALARTRAQKLGLDVDWREMNAEALAFPDHSFDTVVSSLSTCTFPDPVAALCEMGRVCRPDGRILLLEHGRSSMTWVGRVQDRYAERHARRLGCHWNREPLDLVRQAGLRVVRCQRHVFGIYHVIEAAPAAE